MLLLKNSLINLDNVRAFCCLHIFSSEQEVIKGGASYLRIVAFSYPLSAFCTGYLYLMRSIERAKIGTAVFAAPLWQM